MTRPAKGGPVLFSVPGIGATCGNLLRAQSQRVSTYQNVKMPANISQTPVEPWHEQTPGKRQQLATSFHYKTCRERGETRVFHILCPCGTIRKHEDRSSFVPKLQKKTRNHGWSAHVEVRLLCLLNTLMSTSLRRRQRATRQRREPRSAEAIVQSTSCWVWKNHSSCRLHTLTGQLASATGASAFSCWSNSSEFTFDGMAASFISWGKQPSV